MHQRDFLPSLGQRIKKNPAWNTANTNSAIRTLSWATKLRCLPPSGTPSFRKFSAISRRIYRSISVEIKIREGQNNESLIERNFQNENLYRL
jgi:hypothetical protein